jgi:hypothetical protein
MIFSFLLSIPQVCIFNHCHFSSNHQNRNCGFSLLDNMFYMN